MSDTVQTIDSWQTQAIPSIKLRKSRKAPAIKTAVILSRANGKPWSHIAKDLHIAVNTAKAIAEESDVDRHLSIGQQMSVSLIPEAIRVAEVRLSQNSENMAIKVLENTIWPLQSKTSKQPDTALTLAIQNLMGNVQVNAAAPTTNSGLPDNSTAISVESTQVIENKEGSS